MKYFYKGLFKYLICRGADVNAQNDQGYAPLHLAANEGNIDIHTINVWEFINIWKKKSSSM